MVASSIYVNRLLNPGPFWPNVNAQHRQTDRERDRESECGHREGSTTRGRSSCDPATRCGDHLRAQRSNDRFNANISGAQIAPASDATSSNQRSTPSQSHMSHTTHSTHMCREILGPYINAIGGGGGNGSSELCAPYKQTTREAIALRVVIDRPRSAREMCTENKICVYKCMYKQCF